ncbi:cpsG domain protein, partial [Vibrio parahaemolyticus V-223/04]
YQQLCTDK